MASKTKRYQIVGLKTAEITKQFDVCRKTVLNDWKRYSETATTSNKPIPRQKLSISTKIIVQAVM